MKQFYTSLSPSPPLLRFIVPSHPWTTGRESSLLLTCFSYYSCRCRQNASDCGCRRVDILFVCAWVSEWESVCEWVCIRLLVQGRGEMRRLKQSTVLSYAHIFLVLVYFLSVHPLFASNIIPGPTYSGVQVRHWGNLTVSSLNKQDVNTCPRPQLTLIFHSTNGSGIESKSPHALAPTSACYTFSIPHPIPPPCYILLWFLSKKLFTRE